MKKLSLTMAKFPKPLNGSFEIRFTEKALIRGAIAAGQDPRKQVTSKDAIAHMDALAATIGSSLDTSGDSLSPTDHFLKLGPTLKGDKSFAIGNALCAHVALKKLGIPWLIDIESPPNQVNFGLKKGSRQRPDFIGKNKMGQWYVFESKGRTSRPNPGDLKKWKKQSKSICTINGAKPIGHIVSASYLNAQKQWEVLWVDPPNQGDDLMISDSQFFKTYYRCIYKALVESELPPEKSKYGPFIELPESGVRVGLHQEVFDALREDDYDQIWRFRRQYSGREADGPPEEESLFPDGFVISMDHKSP